MIGDTRIKKGLLFVGVLVTGVYVSFFAGGIVFESGNQPQLVPAYQEWGTYFISQLSTPNDVGLDLSLTTDEEYRAAIIGLLWHIHELAVQKGQALREGMYVIEDPGQKILQFLMGYQKMYERRSSHFPGMKKKQYGIDIVHGRNKTLVLPYGNRHILFGSVYQKEYIFIEPEQHGTWIVSDFFLHMCDFMKYFLTRKFCPWLFEREGIRHESVPYSVAQAWDQLTKTLPMCLDKNRDRAVKDMVAKINQELENGNHAVTHHACVKTFYKTIEQYDHLNVRLGREVIITHDDLLQKSMQRAK